MSQGNYFSFLYFAIFYFMVTLASKRVKGVVDHGELVNQGDLKKGNRVIPLHCFNDSG